MSPRGRCFLRDSHLLIPPPLFCLQRCEEIDGSLSFCAYNLKGANSDIQDLLKMKLHAAGDSLLHEQLEVRPILPFFLFFPFLSFASAHGHCPTASSPPLFSLTTTNSRRWPRSAQRRPA